MMGDIAVAHHFAHDNGCQLEPCLAMGRLLLMYQLVLLIDVVENSEVGVV